MTPTLFSLKARNSQILYLSSVVLLTHLDSRKLQEVNNISTGKFSTIIPIVVKQQAICATMVNLLSTSNKFAESLPSKKFLLEQLMR
jgi:hypothetical protein